MVLLSGAKVMYSASRRSRHKHRIIVNRVALITIVLQHFDLLHQLLARRRIASSPNFQERILVLVQAGGDEVAALSQSCFKLGLQHGLLLAESWAVADRALT
jgi:hypothetical protein